MVVVNPDSPFYTGPSRAPFTVNGKTDAQAAAARLYAPAPAPAQPQRPPTRAAQAFSALEQARQEYRAGLDEIRQSDLTDKGKAKARAELAAAHAQKVDASEAEVKALRDEAAAQYAAKRASLATVEHTPEGESKASRVWQRHRTALDNAKSPTAKLREIIATAPQDELAVVLQEGPAHLDASGQPTSWVDQAVEQRSSELAAARQRVEKAERLAEVAQVEVAKLRKGFQTGDTPSQPLVDAPALGFDPDI
jgi:hypothetical protein